MRIVHRFNKGQSTLEYAILVIVVIAALLTISAYVKKGIQGRAKSATDDIGGQYEPNNTNYDKWTNTSSSTRQTFKTGVTKTIQLADEVTNSVINQQIVNRTTTYWGH